MNEIDAQHHFKKYFANALETGFNRFSPTLAKAFKPWHLKAQTLTIINKFPRLSLLQFKSQLQQSLIHSEWRTEMHPYRQPVARSTQRQ